MKNNQRLCAQRGATLIVGLIMLLLLTLMVSSAFTLSGVNLKAVGNMQSHTEVTAAANAAIESKLSSDSIFRNPAVSTVTVGPYSVSVDAPVCIRAVDVKTLSSNDAYPNIYIDGDSSAGGATGYKETYWNIRAVVDDAVTSARIAVNQGVKLTLPASPNPCP